MTELHVFTSKCVQFNPTQVSHNSPKNSVCHQNHISVIYRPVPHSDVVIKHSWIHDNITVPEWCWWRTALLIQSGLAETIHLKLGLVHYAPSNASCTHALGWLTNQDRPPKTCLSHAGASSGSYLDSWEADHRIQIQKHNAPILRHAEGCKKQTGG